MSDDIAYSSGRGPGAWINQDLMQAMARLRRELTVLGQLQEECQPGDPRLGAQLRKVRGLQEMANSIYDEMCSQRHDIETGKESGYKANTSGIRYGPRWY